MKGMKESAMSGMSKATGSLQGLDPRVIDMIMSRLNFPASKNDLITRAQDSGASQGILDVLNQFEDKQYNSSDDVKAEYQRVQKR
ncbi:DUF2795 domain-containing protein [Methanoculleus sp. Wushi-C6]|uniref:DUF2795 domain-containing protein n=1 Tax=Methanoculleus caldifontis TaxID=2651577 RepID=A0ABU3X241_9EURY|nr:DUF2795 domain-containing protein [Methanoculleus sp. Wushi-C6]MDV2482123.1 DUF2795 domain-containing protein [Methanoculleus sp. Wushi-C6]